MSCQLQPMQKSSKHQVHSPMASLTSVRSLVRCWTTWACPPRATMAMFSSKSISTMRSSMPENKSNLHRLSHSPKLYNWQQWKEKFQIGMWQCLISIFKRLLWVSCPGHGGIQRNHWADLLVGKAVASALNDLKCWQAVSFSSSSSVEWSAFWRLYHCRRRLWRGEKRIVVAWLSVCRWGVGDCVGEELYPFG